MTDNTRTNKLTVIKESFLDRYYTMPISQQEIDFLLKHQKDTVAIPNQINKKELNKKNVNAKQQNAN